MTNIKINLVYLLTIIVLVFHDMPHLSITNVTIDFMLKEETTTIMK